MKKIIIALGAALLLFIGCKKSVTNETTNTADETIAVSKRNCASNDVLQQQLQADPSLRDKMDAIEAFTERVVNNPNAARLLPDGTMEIPVVVNVVYKTTAQNVSQAQIQSQIDVLNEDYGGTNSDHGQVPSVFQPVTAGNVGVHFVLDQVVRTKTNKSSFGTNDAVKKTNQGGQNPTSPTTKLNLWVCNLSGGILGYAQFPGGAAATDGVVIDDNAFGRVGTAAAPFNKGRTATHEIGHWMNLRHIWGDATCGTDQVGDTPPHRTSNFGCPGVINVTCTSNSTTNPNGFTREMTMNYMDYTDDACMFMFSSGQKSRMLAVFAVGGPRASFR